VDAFVSNYGEWMRSLGEEMWRNRARSGTDARYFAYPLLKEIAERSRAVIVHNPAAARMVREHAADAQVIEIPHAVLPAPVPAAYDVERLRAAWNAPANTCVLGVFGYLRESKRLPVILRAFHRALDSGADLMLLIAGSFASSDLERALAGQLQHPRIRRAPFLEEPAFTLHAAAVDVCLNLRYPPAGETSGIAIRLMALGKPVVFTSGEEIAHIRQDARLAVDAGPAEEDLLTEYLLWLSSDHQARRAIGDRARAHVESEHRLDRVAELYLNVLTGVTSPTPEPT
jgi:glycosyltransferase involved in cell wall biosynthesis